MKPFELPPATPPDVRAGFDQLCLYADFVSTVGVERGLIGPREAERLWPRHLLNCAAVADPASSLLPESASVIDVGSGAGLPGIVWSILRPDLKISLIEPMQRRVDFLQEALELLSLDSRITVTRARAEELPGEVTADVVTARAVAPLTKLAVMLLPLVAPGGTMVAIKGATAGDEVRGAAKELKKLGAVSVQVVKCGEGWLEQPTTVVVATRDAESVVAGKRKRGGRDGRKGASRATR